MRSFGNCVANGSLNKNCKCKALSPTLRSLQLCIYAKLDVVRRTHQNPMWPVVVSSACG